MNKRRTPSTPGEILKEEFMVPLGMDAKTLAERSQITSSTISRILNGRVAVSTPSALKLAKLFNTTPDFWLNLQRAVDIYSTMRDKEFLKQYDSIERVH